MTLTPRKFTTGPPLQLLPLQSIVPDVPEDTDPAYTALESMLPLINATLAEHHVSLDKTEDMYGSSAQIQFLHRTKDESSITPENLTVLIPALWDEARPLAWLRVVSDLRAMLVQRPYTRSVKVELIARQLYGPQTFDVVEENRPIVEKWTTLETQLQEIISRSERLRNSVCSLGVIRMGYVHWSGGDPLPTVVLVVVNWDINPCEWDQTQASMRNVLRENDLAQVDVVFTRGEISAGAFSLQTPLSRPHAGDILSEKAYNTAVDMGADIGPAKDFTTSPGKFINGPSGTMGGYIKVTNVATGEAKHMGLTNTV
ncbi:MAG: hypothetical protein Q9191_002830 [Dirinaria sp. TL-2023a]